MDKATNDKIDTTNLKVSVNQFCVLECEKYILRKHGIKYNDDILTEETITKKWYIRNGRHFSVIGKHLKKFGFTIKRKRKASIEYLIHSLNNGNDVIVAVDGGELFDSDSIEEVLEDIYIGEIADHTIVVESYDANNDNICIFDPNNQETLQSVSLCCFINAWLDSKCYLVEIIHP